MISRRIAMKRTRAVNTKRSADAPQTLYETQTLILSNLSDCLGMGTSVLLETGGRGPEWKRYTKGLYAGLQALVYVNRAGEIRAVAEALR
jgi:hypothetical protein